MFDKILCIDDDPITLMLGKMILAKVDFCKEIDTAKNGQDALNYFEALRHNNKVRPGLIFLDLNMPIMDGWEFLDSFATERYEVFNSTKVIILSSTIDPNDLEKSKKYPAVIDFLSKPISKAMLQALQEKL